MLEDCLVVDRESSECVEYIAGFADRALADRAAEEQVPDGPGTRVPSRVWLWWGGPVGGGEARCSYQ